MSLELPEDLAEWIADAASIYGSGDGIEENNRTHSDNCNCRMCFVRDLTDRIRTARDDELALERGRQNPSTSKAELSILKTKIEIYKKGLQAVAGLIDNSLGIYGLHLNGDNSPWHELMPGGQFESWLSDFYEALQNKEGKDHV